MSVLAEFVVPADEFVLADTLTVAPSMRIEIKRVVGGETVVTPYFWASGGDFTAFEQALRDDDEVREVLMLEESGDPVESDDEASDERFYRVQWESTVPNLVGAVSDASASILEAVSADGARWEVRSSSRRTRISRRSTSTGPGRRRHREPGTDRRFRLAFDYAGYRVTVAGDGTIDVELASGAAVDSLRPGESDVPRGDPETPD